MRGGELNKGQVIDPLYEGGEKKNSSDRAKQRDTVGVDYGKTGW
jgi:hypothetical protein